MRDGALDAFGEEVDGAFLLGPVVLQEVHASVSGVEAQEGGGGGVVAIKHVPEGIGGRGVCGFRERAEEAEGDVTGHFVETGGGVCFREGLVFVVVALGDIDLADAARVTDAGEISHHAGLDAPVGREAECGGDAAGEADFATDRVAEKAQRPRGFFEARKVVHGIEEWSEEEAHDAAVEFAGKAGAVAFRNLEAHVGMQDGKGEAHEKLAAVVDDIAVVDGDGGGLCGGEGVGEAEAHVAAFAHGARLEACGFEVR